MKSLSILAFACALGAQTTPPPPALPDLDDSAVIAVFDDGVKLTMGQFRAITGTMLGDNQQMVQRNPQAFLHQYAVMRRLSAMAESEKLDKQSPAREMLDYNRLMILAQVKLTNGLATVTVEPEEVEKFYAANRDRYKQVRVKAIYISFKDAAAGETAAGKKPLTEEQAKTKAAHLLAELRKGADFAKLARENSNDETSRAKDGEFATVRPADNIPDAMRTAVFALKQGEVSEPVRQPNGFYLFRAEEIGYRPLEQVTDEIFTQVKQVRYGEWMRDVDTNTKVQYPNPAFQPGAAAAAPPATPAAPQK